MPLSRGKLIALHISSGCFQYTNLTDGVQRGFRVSRLFCQKVAAKVMPTFSGLIPNPLLTNICPGTEAPVFFGIGSRYNGSFQILLLSSILRKGDNG